MAKVLERKASDMAFSPFWRLESRNEKLGKLTIPEVYA
jgi:hypothetical protein